MRDNLRTLYAAVEQGFAAPLPGFVKDELEGYIDCGVLSRGFAVLACPECTERRVLGFTRSLVESARQSGQGVCSPTG